MSQRDLNFAIVDLETTGLDARVHEIIDIGVVVCRQDNFQIIDEWGAKVRPQYPERMRPKAQELNGYTPSKWLGAMELKDAMHVFAPKLRNAIFTTQNPTFDWPFVRDAVDKYGYGLAWEDDWFYHRLDIWSVAMMALRNVTGLPKLNQDYLQGYLGVEPEPEPHDALEGARLSYRILRALMHGGYL